MLNTTDGNGIFGYENSKQKKIKDNLLGYGNMDEKLVSPLTAEQRASMIDDAQKASAQMAYESSALAAPIDKAARIRQYNEDTKNFLVPSPNDEMRRRRQFVTADNIVQDATDSIFKNNVKGVFDRVKGEAEKSARKEYGSYSAVPGDNYMSALGALRRESDPEKVIESTMQQIDNDELNRIANQYASYAQMSPADYRKQILEPNIKNRLYKEYVEEATPKSSAEYIARTAYDNSLAGKVMDISLNAHSRTNSQSLIDREGLASYDANRMEKLAGGIGSLLLDMPVFSALGTTSGIMAKGTAAIAKNITSSLMKRMAAKGLQVPAAKHIVENALKNKMLSKIANATTSQAFTLGGYDAGHSVADDLLTNEGIDVEKAVNAYGHGLAMGASLGVLSSPIKYAARGLTGGKKVAASAAAFGVEAGVFTAGGALGKIEAGVDVEPIDLVYDFAENAATLGAMKLAHWRPKGGYAKLNADGKLRNELKLTAAEQQEIKSAGVEPQAFITDLEASLSSAYRKSQANLEEIAQNYTQIMSSPRLSANTRAKLLYLVENKITSTPPIPVKYDVKMNPSGRYSMMLLDADGYRIGERSNITKGELDKALSRIEPVLRRNQIATLEAELLGTYDSDNYFQQAAAYAESKGINARSVVDAMYKRVNGEQLSPKEQSMLDDISERAGYGSNRVGFMLQNLRRNIEKNYGLEENSLLNAIDRDANQLSQNENRALNEYLVNIQNEVTKLNGGVNKERLSAIDKDMAASSYGNQSNYDAKMNESRLYIENKEGRNEEVPYAAGNRMSFPYRVPQNWSKPYAWSLHGVRNTSRDIANYENHARKIADRLGCEIDFIYDERHIPFDSEHVEEYNNKVASLGWLDNNTGKVYINLPNIRNTHELEKTVVHEMIGHSGLSNLMGEYIYEFYNDLYNHATPELRKEIHNAGQKYGLSGYSAIEELLSTIAEKGSYTKSEAKLLSRFKNFVKGKLVQNKLISPDNNSITITDLQNFMMAHKRAMFEKKHPNEYRSQLLGKFPKLNNLPDYYNRGLYEQDMRNRYPDVEQELKNTPSFLWGERRELLDYERRRNTPSSYRLIGKRGAERLANSEYKDYLIDNTTERAEEMERQNKTPHEIWKETGWERGADGEWRHEIDEEQLELRDLLSMVLYQKDKMAFAAYNVIKDIPEERMKDEHKQFMNAIHNNSEQIYRGAHIKLRHLVNDPLLFTAYPDLKDVPVEVTSRIDRSCKYDSHRGVLYVNPNDLIENYMLVDDIVPEIQRMIQGEENFSRSVDLMRANIENSLKTKYNEVSGLARKLAALKEEKLTQGLYQAFSKEFARVYGIEPEYFDVYYPTGNEYILKMIYNEPRALSSDIEAYNVKYRNYIREDDRATQSPMETEILPRDKQVPHISLREVEKLLSGPIDAVRSSFNIGFESLLKDAVGRKSNNDPEVEEARALLIEKIKKDYVRNYRPKKIPSPYDEAYEFYDKLIEKYDKDPIARDYFIMHKKNYQQQLLESMLEKMKKMGVNEYDNVSDLSKDFYTDQFGRFVPKYKSPLVYDLFYNKNPNRSMEDYYRNQKLREMMMPLDEDDPPTAPVDRGPVRDLELRMIFDNDGNPIVFPKLVKGAKERGEKRRRELEDYKREIREKYGIDDDVDIKDKDETDEDYIYDTLH